MCSTLLIPSIHPLAIGGPIVQALQQAASLHEEIHNTHEGLCRAVARLVGGEIAPLDQQFILGILFALPGEVQCAVQVSLFNWFQIGLHWRPPFLGFWHDLCLHEP